MTASTRRDIVQGALVGGAAVVGGAALGIFGVRAARAAAPLADTQAAGFYRMRLGDYEVTVLNDGMRSFPLPDTFVRNVPKDEALAATQAAYMPPGQGHRPVQPDADQHRPQARADRHRKRTRTGRRGRGASRRTSARRA